MSSPGEAGDDADVITASLRQPERFAVVFDRHAAHIHRYLARRLGGQLAEDLMGETFLIAFGGRGRYDPAFRSARPWLYGIATNSSASAVAKWPTRRSRRRWGSRSAPSGRA